MENLVNNIIMIQMNCKVCGELFKAKNKKFKICSKKCRNKINTEYARKYRRENKGIIKAISRRLYLKNGDKIRKKSKSYYEKTKDKWIAYSRNRTKNNKETLIKAKKEYYQKNKEEIKLKAKIYYVNNKKKMDIARKKYFNKSNVKKRKLENNKLLHNIKISSSRNTDITLSYMINLKKIITHCTICNVKLTNKYNDNQRHLDHIIPLGVGGKHMKNNIRYLCRKCNLGRPKDGSDIYV